MGSLQNYAAVIEYDGTGFKGFQAQPGDLRTVQGEITGALTVLADDFCDFSYAGRTDAGVHAKKQVISFKTARELDFHRFRWKLNCLLPEDIVVKEIKKVGLDFNARRDAVLREYSYYVVNNYYQSVFFKRFSIMVTAKLDLELMREAAKKFTGVKDFGAFCNNNLDTGSNVREVYNLKIRKFREGLLVFKIAANSFLYNMVRIIVGTLLEAGKHERDLESIDAAFETGSRHNAGKIVPSRGLVLTNVIY